MLKKFLKNANDDATSAQQAFDSLDDTATPEETSAAKKP